MTEQQEQQWHVAIGLDDFVADVSKLQHIVDVCNTAELGLVDKAKFANFMQWGVFIEEVMKSVTTDKQRDALARALLNLSAGGPSRSAHLHHARAWILGSMLGSAFLGDHPKPDALLTWIMWEYAKLPNLTDPASEKQPVALGTFVEDAGDIVVSHGMLAVLSSAYSALLVCAAGNERVSASSVSNIGCESPRQRPHVYQMSVETAQKRAYGSECYDRLLAEWNQDVEQREPGVPGNRATSFLRELADVAGRDTVALEVLCFMLLEPWRRTPSIDSLHSSLGSALLKQVLAFRGDARLWHLNKWLLFEVSHRYESFAEAYVEETERRGLDCEDIGMHLRRGHKQSE